jgi:hypothetical protein
MQQLTTYALAFLHRTGHHHLSAEQGNLHMVCGFLYVSSPLQRKENFVPCPHPLIAEYPNP